LNQRTTYALAPVSLSDNHHGNVSVRHSVSKGTEKADNFAAVDCHKCALRAQHELAKLLGVRNAAIPTSLL
jgi:hypothetical protein